MVQIIKEGMQKEATKVEPESFKTNTLGAKVGNTLLGFFRRATNSITDWFEERLINFAVGVLVKVEKSGKTILGSLIKELKKHEAIPDFLKPIFDEIENPKHEIGAMLASTAGSSAIGGLFGAIFDPLMASVKYSLQEVMSPYYPTIDQAVYGKLAGVIDDTMEREIFEAQGFDGRFHDIFRKLFKNRIPFAELTDLYRRGHITETLLRDRIKLLGFDDLDVEMLINLITRLPDISSSVIAFFRGTIDRDKLDEIAKQNGITQEFLDILISANRRLIELGDIRSIYYRTGKSDTWLEEQLKKVGYSDDNIKDLKSIFPYFPAVPDLIRFAVREVYSPEIVEKYGQMEDLPSKFLEEAKKAGLPEDQAKNYWAAHWELPSAGQGFEMLHRGVITYEELKTLLRTLDVMPYWRDKLIEIAYSPLTRVDVRRMYNLGILNEDQVYNAYKAIGYNDENAKYMTQFTIAYYQQADKNLTRSNIQDGYKRKYFSRDEAITLLKEIGYDEDEAEFYLSKIDYDEEMEKKKDLLKLLESAYKKDVYTDNEVIEMLSNEGFQATEIDYHLTKWTVSKKVKTAKPDKSELKSWLAKKIVSRETFIEEMKSLGYADKYIDLYLREVTGKGL